MLVDFSTIFCVNNASANMKRKVQFSRSALVSNFSLNSYPTRLLILKAINSVGMNLTLIAFWLEIHQVLICPLHFYCLVEAVEDVLDFVVCWVPVLFATALVVASVKESQKAGVVILDKLRLFMIT